MNLKEIRKELNELKIKIDHDYFWEETVVVIRLFDIVNNLVKELEKERGES